ncbi:MAG TPA: hypothetical protein PLD62_07580, partial [Candidatus Cloacimonadota bacterium]|nr:hypothetical protein [Candidatus Cloacimonadota bacterium]
MKSFRFIFLLLILVFYAVPDNWAVFQKIGEIEWTSLGGVQVEVVDNIAYTLEYMYLNIYDVSDPSNPILMSNTYLGNELLYMQIKDQHAYISGNYGKFIIIDITDPVSPIVTDEIYFSGYAYYHLIKRLCVKGNYAYLDYYDYSTYESKLLIADISDPYNCSFVNNLSTDVSTDCMFINGNYLYLFGFGDYSGCAYDLSDNANPILYTTYDNLYIDYAEVKHDTVYCVNAWYFRIYDFSNPQNINLLTTYDTDIELNYVHVENNKAYLACGERGLKIFDISDYTNITEIGVFDTQMDGSIGVMQLALIGENAIILTEWSDNAFQIIDISDPTPPAELVASYDYYCRENSLIIHNDL